MAEDFLDIQGGYHVLNVTHSGKIMLIICQIRTQLTFTLHKYLILFRAYIW